MRTLISILCSMTLLSSGVEANISFGEAAFNCEETIITTRTLDVFQTRMEDLTIEANKTLDLDNQICSNTLDNITTIYSFSGSEYILAEYKPTGYIIYDSESGTFLESSASAISPYVNISGDKYYGGPNEYYYETKDNDIITYTHTIYGDIIQENNLEPYVEACTEMDILLSESPNNMVLSYIREGGSLKSKASVYSSEVNGMTYVKNYSFFTKLANCGYTSINGNGICGYIAAGILLTYDAVVNYYPTVNSLYYSKSSSGAYSISTSFPELLYDVGVSLGYGTSTTSVAIHYTVEEYLKDKGITASHTSLYTPFATNSNIRGKIDDDRPVIWFGNIASNSHNSMTNIQHAIVVYGYEYGFWSGTAYVAHFGWTGATAISFSGIMGSMYTYSITSITTLG